MLTCRGAGRYKEWCLSQTKIANFEVLAASVAEEFVFLGYDINLLAPKLFKFF
jgi:hypothetical protein